VESTPNTMNVSIVVNAEIRVRRTKLALSWIYYNRLRPFLGINIKGRKDE
jgi:hypothetical protein